MRVLICTINYNKDLCVYMCKCMCVYISVCV